MNEQTYVAIDLGSNSFHLLIARDDNGTLQVIDKLKVMVQLAAGLDKKNRLDEQTKQRAIQALARFGERIKQVKNAQIRVVGTSTLRRAKNNTGFIEQAESLLGVPIEIISGSEEARLIYIGVCSNMPHDREHRMVIDIGGGSTEFIIGQDRSPLQLESLHLGCIRFSQKYGQLPLKPRKLAAAQTRVEQNLQDILPALNKMGWRESIGASGSIKAVSRVSDILFDDPIIRLSNLKKIAAYLQQPEVNTNHLVKKFGFEQERAQVFTGGFLILFAAMRALNIKQLIPSDNAIREGVIWELIGREMAKDIRHQTVDAVSQRFSLNHIQAEAVKTIAHHLLSQVKQDLTASFDAKNTLRWAAQLHELGLAISHSSHHKHGAYLVSQMDMAGFSKTVQARLAKIIRTQRKSLDPATIQDIPAGSQTGFCLLILIFRISVLLCRSQETGYEKKKIPQLELRRVPEKGMVQTHYQLLVKKSWIKERPLTAFDLKEEAEEWLPGRKFPIYFSWATKK